MAARVLGLMSSAGSLLEFIFGPCFGRLSDRYGRMVFLLVGPVGTILCDGMVFLFPSQPVLIVGKVVSTLTVTAFVTILRSSLNDVVQGEAYAIANSGMATWTGSAVMLTPLLASRFLTERGSFGVAALAAAVNGAQLSLFFGETLPRNERVQVDWVKCNPLSFVKLFSHSKTMSLLVLAIFFQSVGEIRFAMDMAMIIWARVHQWSPAWQANFTALFGAAMVAAGRLGVLTIGKFGQKGHTRLSNWVNAVGNSIWACDTGLSGSLLAQLLMTFGHRKRDGLEAMIYRLGTTATDRRPALGGRGAVSGMLANFKSVAFVVAPQLYSFAYATGTGSGRAFHGAPMLVAALAALCAEACVMLLPSMTQFEALCAAPNKPTSNGNL